MTRAVGEHALRRMKLRDLRILIAVAKAGSMAQAATQLSMAQPAVSKAVQDLEAILGARLFDRTPRGVEPTVLGSALLRRVVAALDELSQGATELQTLANPERGELRFCCSEGMASGIVPVILDKLLTERPRLTFHVYSSETPNRSYGRLVADREVELALSRYPAPFESTDLEVEHLFDDPLVVVAGKNHPAARRRTLRLEQLLDQRWILMPTDAAVAGVMHRVFSEAGLPLPEAAIYTMSIHVRYAMLAAGDCVTMLPASSLQVSPFRTMLARPPIKLPGKPGPVGLVKIKGRSLSPVAALFAQAAREVSREVMGHPG
ncbi:MAG: LysR family transcriptional regulator [Hyphomicrobiaceae bacterium]